jgi:hypothetical protein
MKRRLDGQLPPLLPDHNQPMPIRFETELEDVHIGMNKPFVL